MGEGWSGEGQEGFLVARTIRPHLTTQCLWPPPLPRCRGATLSIVALHAERTQFVRSMWEQVSEARARPRGPWLTLGVECEGPDGAARFEEWVTGALRGPLARRVAIVGHAQVLLRCGEGR